MGQRARDVVSCTYEPVNLSLNLNLRPRQLQVGSGYSKAAAYAHVKVSPDALPFVRRPWPVETYIHIHVRSAVVAAGVNASRIRWLFHPMAMPPQDRGLRFGHKTMLIDEVPNYD